MDFSFLLLLLAFSAKEVDLEMSLLLLFVFLEGVFIFESRGEGPPIKEALLETPVAGVLAEVEVAMMTGILFLVNDG